MPKKYWHAAGPSNSRCCCCRGAMQKHTNRLRSAGGGVSIQPSPTCTPAPGAARCADKSSCLPVDTLPTRSILCFLVCSEFLSAIYQPYSITSLLLAPRSSRRRIKTEPGKRIANDGVRGALMTDSDDRLASPITILNTILAETQITIARHPECQTLPRCHHRLRRRQVGCRGHSS